MDACDVTKTVVAVHLTVRFDTKQLLYLQIRSVVGRADIIIVWGVKCEQFVETQITTYSVRSTFGFT